MNLYLIKRIKVRYDENASHVVAAEDAAQARSLAAEKESHGSLFTVHAREDWLNPSKSSIRLIGTTTIYSIPQIVHTHFYAG